MIVFCADTIYRTEQAAWNRRFRNPRICGFGATARKERNMAKRVSLTAANAVRNILKNKQDFHADLRSSEQDGNRTVYVFDVFFQDAIGTFTIAKENDEIPVAVLNFSMGKIFSKVNDMNIEKLASYVLDTAL